MAQEAAQRRGCEPERQGAVERVGWREPWLPLGPASPFTCIRRFAEEMDRLFEDFGLGDITPRIQLRGGRQWMPHLEVCERGGSFIVRADLPGIKRDDVSVEVRDDELCIAGERREAREEREEGFYRTERQYGRFYRSVPLPEGVDPEKAEATFRDGVLEVKMPMTERASRRRRIQIVDGGQAAQGGAEKAAK